MPILKECDECGRHGGYAPQGSDTCARCLNEDSDSDPVDNEENNE